MEIDLGRDTQRSLEETVMPPPTARVYHVPARFGIGALMAVTALFCGLFGVMRLLGMHPLAMAYVGMQVVAAGLTQAFYSRRPRAASTVTGAVLLPLMVVSYAFFFQDLRAYVWDVLTPAPCIVITGALFGYLAGGLIAGVFMLTEMADDWVARKKTDALVAKSPDLCEEETGTVRPAAGAGHDDSTGRAALQDRVE